jgi:uncharacterized protein
MTYCRPRLGLYTAFFILGLAVALGAFFLLEDEAQLPRPALSDIRLDDTIVERSIPIVAVDPDKNEGAIGKLNVRVIPGDSHVLIDINPYLEPDVQYSANVAVAVAKDRTGEGDDSDFVLTYDVPGTIVGGGSAGAATALAVMAALEGKSIRDDAVITGSIEPDGKIGPVGGVYEKAKAAAENGDTLFLVPEGQSKVRTYERIVQREPSVFGFRVYNTRYESKTTDIVAEAKGWGLVVREVSDIDEAAKEMLV